MHDHSHNHTHEHTDNSDNSHKKSVPDNLLLKFMLDHNIQHVKDAEEFATKLKDKGNDEVATLILEAVSNYIKGNDKLSAALDSLKNNE